MAEEDLIAEFQARIRFIREGPILYRADPDLPQLLSDELAAFAAKGLPDVLIRATMDTFIQVHTDHNPEVEAEYVRARQVLEESIRDSPLLAKYRAEPTSANLESFVAQFLDTAPRHMILKFAGLHDYWSRFLGHRLNPISDDDRRKLQQLVSRLVRIEIDEIKISEAVTQVQNIITSCDNLVLAWVLVIGFTPEGFTFQIEGQPKYKYHRTLTALVFNGLRNFVYPDPLDGEYMVWWSQLYNLLHIEASCAPYQNLLMAVFPQPSYECLGDVVPPELHDTVQLCGEAFAALCTVYETEAMQQMILTRLTHMYLEGLAPTQQPLDLPFRRWAWEALPTVSRMARGTFEAVAEWIYTARKLASQWTAPVTILSPVIGLMYTCCTAAYEFLDKLVDVLVYGLDKVASPTIRWLKEYLYLGRAWASVVLPGARRRPKSVWALLFVNDFTRLDPGTRFALSCKVMEETPSPSYAEWEANFHKAINDTNLGTFKLFHHEPLRPLRVPANPYTVDEEVLAMAPLFPGRSRTVEFMDEKLEKWRQYNVPQGIDGQWFATPERVAQSLRRYNCERVEPDDYTTGLLRETAHALADKYPEMYKYHRYFTVEHAMRRLKWDTNMSPGLGFMGNVKTRRQLRQFGLLAAVQKVATDILMNGGPAPGSVAHAFVKEQVVSLEKLLKGKNIRTVTAMDLLSNTLALPFSIELSRAPPPEAYVLNALPRSEGGYRPIFDELKKHALVIQADAHEFDSKLAPVVTVEGLAELRSIGFEENPAIDVIKSQIRSHYYHMRHAALVDLTTGTVFDKNGGMMTGQVNTSYDNRDSFRLALISCWSHVTGRPPHLFWETNTLGNAGDDDVIGSEEAPDVWKEIFKAMKIICGIVVEVEQIGWDNLSITALQPTPEMQDTAYYRAQLGMPTVTYGIRTEPAKLLLAKTEFKMRTARLSDIPFRQAHIDSMVGTAYLCAYNPEIYQDLADLYLADMRYILLRFYEKVEVTEQRDKYGNLSNLEIRGVKVRARYHRVQSKIDSMIKAWQKKVKWPAYQRVFNIWVRPYNEERSSIAKHYRTLTSNGPALPVAWKILYGLVGFRENLYKIPNHIVRALPEFPGADISVTLKTPEFIVEQFVWLSLFHKINAIPTKQAFMTALREGPYSSAASPVDFLEHLEQENFMRDLINRDLEELRGQAICVTLIYSFLEIILQRAAQTPMLGILITLYALATRDVNRLYATANHIYWLACGRSSSVISNLMPADPYAWMKQVAVILTTGIPASWVNIPGSRLLVDWVPGLVEAWTLTSATIAPNIGRLTFREPPVNSPWAFVIDRINEIARNNVRFTTTIVAPTGSGKSTLFVALLNRIFPSRKIWLLHPTRTARDEYTNDFMPDGCVQALSRGIQRRPDAIILSVTYGYFTQIITTVLETDIVLLDEVHLSATESWVAWWLAHNQIRFCLTATPKYSLQPRTDHEVRYPGTRRFQMKMSYFNQTFEQLWTTLANTRRELLHRALIICPTLQQVQYVRNTLDRLSFPSSELSSNNPVPASNGIIVATSIADQALTITPPPSTVIDLGTMLKVTRSWRLGYLIPFTEVEVVPVSQEVADQRAGRGGRHGDAEGFGLLNAPRSPHEPPTRHPSAVFLHEDVVDAVLMSLGLRNPLTPLNAVAGLLKFIQLDQRVGAIPQTHNLALAAVIFLYLSGGSDHDDIKHDFLNYKIANIESDTMRVYCDQVNSLYPELRPILGEFDQAWEMLEGGLFQCQIGTSYYPVAAFMFIEGWLCPVGQDPSVLMGGRPRTILPSAAAPVVHRGIREDEWQQILPHFRIPDFIAPGPPDAPLSQGFGSFVSTQVTLPHQVPAAIVALLNRVRRAMDLKITSQVVNFMWNQDQYNSLITNLALMPDGNTIPLRRVVCVDVSDLPLQVEAFLPLLLLTAANLRDDQVLAYGVYPEMLSRQLTLKTNKLVVAGPPDAVTFVVISPLMARRVVAESARALHTGDIKPIFSHIPVVVLDSFDDFAAWEAIPTPAVCGTIVNGHVILV